MVEYLKVHILPGTVQDQGYSFDGLLPYQISLHRHERAHEDVLHCVFIKPSYEEIVEDAVEYEVGAGKQRLKIVDAV